MDVTSLVGSRFLARSGSVLARREALALALFLRLELRRQVGAEVLRLEHAADLDLLVALLERRAPDPLDGLLHGLHLPQPEAADQLLGLGERAIDHAALAAAELDAHALGARVQPLARQHHAGLHQLLVELTHLAENLAARQHAPFRILVRPDDHHDAHDWLLLRLRLWQYDE